MPNNPWMVTHKKKVYYRLGIYDHQDGHPLSQQCDCIPSPGWSPNNSRRVIQRALVIVAGWDVVCWLYSQIRNQQRCYGSMVTIPMTVTINLQPLLPYVNLALKYHYRTGIWYRNLLGYEMAFDGVWHWRTDSCFFFQFWLIYKDISIFSFWRAE